MTLNLSLSTIYETYLIVKNQAEIRNHRHIIINSVNKYLQKKINNGKVNQNKDYRMTTYFHTVDNVRKGKAQVKYP